MIKLLNLINEYSQTTGWLVNIDNTAENKYRLKLTGSECKSRIGMIISEDSYEDVTTVEGIDTSALARLISVYKADPDNTGEASFIPMLKKATSDSDRTVLFLNFEPDIGCIITDVKLHNCLAIAYYVDTTDFNTSISMSLIAIDSNKAMIIDISSGFNNGKTVTTKSITLHSVEEIKYGVDGRKVSLFEVDTSHEKIEGNIVPTTIILPKFDLETVCINHPDGAWSHSEGVNESGGTWSHSEGVSEPDISISYDGNPIGITDIVNSIAKGEVGGYDGDIIHPTIANETNSNIVSPTDSPICQHMPPPSFSARSNIDHNDFIYPDNNVILKWSDIINSTGNDIPSMNDSIIPVTPPSSDTISEIIAKEAKSYDGDMVNIPGIFSPSDDDASVTDTIIKCANIETITAIQSDNISNITEAAITEVIPSLLSNILEDIKYDNAISDNFKADVRALDDMANLEVERDIDILNSSVTAHQELEEVQTASGTVLNIIMDCIAKSLELKEDAAIIDYVNNKNDELKEPSVTLSPLERRKVLLQKNLNK